MAIPLLFLLITDSNAKPIIFVPMTVVTIPNHVLSMTSYHNCTRFALIAYCFDWHLLIDTCVTYLIQYLITLIITNQWYLSPYVITLNIIWYVLAIYGYDCTQVERRPQIGVLWASTLNKVQNWNLKLWLHNWTLRWNIQYVILSEQIAFTYNWYTL